MVLMFIFLGSNYVIHYVITCHILSRRTVGTDMPSTRSELTVDQKNIIINLIEDKCYLKHCHHALSGVVYVLRAGLTRRKVRKTIVIRRVNRVRRVSWCSQKLTWNVKDHWQRVIFSDETQVVIGENKKLHVWRRPDEVWQPSCLGGGRSRRISVMFWGCISYFGVGTVAKYPTRCSYTQNIFQPCRRSFKCLKNYSDSAPA